MKNKFISILLLFLSFFIFTACDGCSGCNNDKENDDKNNEVEAPNETPNELTDEIKTNAVNEIKEVVNGLKQNEYSLENWTNIQNLLVDYTVDIMSSKSISEVNNYVKNFKSISFGNISLEISKTFFICFIISVFNSTKLTYCFI